MDKIDELFALVSSFIARFDTDKESAEPYGEYLLRWYATYKKPYNGKNTSDYMYYYISERISPALGNVPLIVPLVDVERVEVVELLECADCVHICVDTIARGDTVGCEFGSFPFGQRMDDLCATSAHGVDCEADGVFSSVEVIVEACARFDEKRSGNAAQFQYGRQLALKFFFNLLDGDFGCLCQQFTLIAFGYDQCHFLV